MDRWFKLTRKDVTMHRKRTALLLEDSKTIQLHVKQLIEPINYELSSATTLLDLNEFLEKNSIIDIALVSLDLESGNVEEIIDLLIKNKIAVILLSGVEETSFKQRFLKKDIVDYIEKESMSNFNDISKILQRLDTNTNETILVVDDSSLYRTLICNLLLRHKFDVLEAKDGLEALETLEKNKHIKLIITDYEMPNLDGLGVIKNVRETYSVDELPIIVISSLDKSSTIVDCLKNGANDYLHKPFSHQEFYSRLYLTLSHKENLDAAQEQKNIYETLFNESSNGILLVKDGKFIHCNDAALKFLKLDSKNQIINKTPCDFSPDFQADGECSERKRKQLNDKKTERFEWQYLQSDGTPIWIDVLRTPVTIDNEDVVHVVWHDITNMKKLETELETLNHSLEKRVEEEIQKNSLQANQMIEQSRLAQMGEMISMIAHQWRQPLSSISAISSTLSLDVMMDNYDSDFFGERLASIDELSQHLSSTIDDFRGFFKDNKIKELSTIDHILEGTLQIIGSTLQTQSIKVTINVTTTQEVSTYTNEIKQVVLNILKNAEDALLENTKEDRTISIDGYKQDDSIYIKIEDNAGGIPEEIIKNVFDPYFSTKKTKDGTGLGLYMSKTIIEDHCKGKLTVRNGTNGAQFTIILPIETKEN